MVGVGSSSFDGATVGTCVSVSEFIGESELVFLAWRQDSFPGFFGRFASWQAALLAGVLALAKASNRCISECSVAASGISAVLEAAVLCSSGSLSCSVAADGVKADLADNIVLLVE